jgi:hypothetical protein
MSKVTATASSVSFSTFATVRGWNCGRRRALTGASVVVVIRSP